MSEEKVLTYKLQQFHLHSTRQLTLVYWIKWNMEVCTSYLRFWAQTPCCRLLWCSNCGIICYL